MSLIGNVLGRPRRLLRRDHDPVCLVCHRPVRQSEERIRVRGDASVHRRCATYRVRNRRRSGSRLGFPR